MNPNQNRRWIRAIIVAIVGAAIFSIAATVCAQVPADAASAAPDPAAIVALLKQAVDWHQQAREQQRLANEPGELMFASENRRVADQVVRQVFEFAKAEAQAIRTPPAGPVMDTPAGATPQAKYEALVERADKQAKQAEVALTSLNQRLEGSSGRARAALQSAIDETRSELELAQTRRDALRAMVQFVSSTNASATGTASLRSQIEELERTMPPAGDAGANAADRPVGGATRRTETAGILALITDVRELARKRALLSAALQSTELLARATQEMRTPLGANLRQLARRGDAVANQADSTDPVVLARQKADVDAVTREFKQLSAIVLPLSKQAILLDVYKRNVSSWRDSVQKQYSAALRDLAIRVVVLAVVLAMVLGGSRLWRRAILRNAQDVRRRHHLLLLSRAIVVFVVALIIAFAFSAELGSLATFAGLLTAGLALALQNVLLSVVGYFLLIGKYGVRVGDRVQIAGAIGEVVDIGLVRLQIMELGGVGADAQPTGRVVGFSNSVVFQPTGALFKQIPGTSFRWHEIIVTVGPDSDYQVAEQRLLSAVQTVFAEYGEEMERQRKHLQRTLGSVSISSLGPHSRVRLTKNGLEVVIRYPLELHKAYEVDDRVTREVLAAIEREPKLRLVGSVKASIEPLKDPAKAATTIG